jgi:hypothetical protein
MPLALLETYVVKYERPELNITSRLEGGYATVLHRKRDHAAAVLGLNDTLLRLKS